MSPEQVRGRGRRRAIGRLGGRRRALRDAGRARAVPGLACRGDRARDPARGAGAASGVAARRSRRRSSSSCSARCTRTRPSASRADASWRARCVRCAGCRCRSSSGRSPSLRRYRPGPAVRNWPRRLTWAIALLTLSIAAGVWWVFRPVDRIAVAVVPVANQSGYPELEPFRLALTYALVQHLRQARDVHVPLVLGTVAESASLPGCR